MKGEFTVILRHFQHKLQLITVLGAGLLCGTALSIIIPEGVELVQDSWKGEPSIFLCFIHSLPYSGDEYSQSSTLLQRLCLHYSKVSYQLKLTAGGLILSRQTWLCLSIHASSPPHVDWYCSAMGENQNISESNPTLHLTTKKGLRPQFFIGVSLVLGFMLMFVVDQISNYCSMHGTSTLLLIRNTFQNVSTHVFHTETVLRIVMYNRHSFFQTSPVQGF